MSLWKQLFRSYKGSLKTFSGSRTCLWTIKPQGCGAPWGGGGERLDQWQLTNYPRPPPILSSDVECAVTLTTALINRQLSVNQCRGCTELWSRLLSLCYCALLCVWGGGGEAQGLRLTDASFRWLLLSVVVLEKQTGAIALLPALNTLIKAVVNNSLHVTIILRTIHRDRKLTINCNCWNI